MIPCCLGRGLLRTGGGHTRGRPHLGVPAGRRARCHPWHGSDGNHPEIRSHPRRLLDRGGLLSSAEPWASRLVGGRDPGWPRPALCTSLQGSCDLRIFHRRYLCRESTRKLPARQSGFGRPRGMEATLPRKVPQAPARPQAPAAPRPMEGPATGQVPHLWPLGHPRPVWDQPTEVVVGMGQMGLRRRRHLSMVSWGGSRGWENHSCERHRRPLWTEILWQMETCLQALGEAWEHRHCRLLLALRRGRHQGPWKAWYIPCRLRLPRPHLEKGPEGAQHQPHGSRPSKQNWQS